MKKVLVTGATGFLGEYVVDELLKDDWQVTCFVRPTSNTAPLKNYDVRMAYGSFEEVDSFTHALMGMDALVNVASLGFGHAPNILKSCHDAGITRAVFFSTTAIFTTLNASSKGPRTAAEQAIQSSELNYTILRPTMIYGSNRDRNMCRLIKLLKKTPVIPIFGDGKSMQQPVYVRDLAKAVVQVLHHSEKTMRKSYNLSGAKPLTYNDVVDCISKLLKKRTLKYHFSIKNSLRLIKLMSFVPGLPKLKEEQILRLNEDKSFSHEEARSDFNYSPLSFEEGIHLELKQMQLL